MEISYQTHHPAGISGTACQGFPFWQFQTWESHPGRSWGGRVAVPPNTTRDHRTAPHKTSTLQNIPIFK